MKKCISMLLLVIILFSSMVLPTSAVGNQDIFTYELNEDGVSYAVTGIKDKSVYSIVVPSEYNGLPVTVIKNCAFLGCYGNVSVVVIPEGIKEIRDSAFAHFSKLKAISLPLSLEKIGWCAFFESTSQLEYIYYPGTQEQWESIYIDHCGLGGLEIYQGDPIYSAAPKCHVKEEVVISTASKYSSGLTINQCMVCGQVFSEINTPQFLPEQPTIEVCNGEKGVNINLTVRGGDDYYYLYRRTADSGWKRIRTIIGCNSSTCSDECSCVKNPRMQILDVDAKSGTTYYYTMKAKNEGGFSTYNKTGFKIKYVKAPKLTKIANENGVKITWNKVSGADGYCVYRADANDNSDLAWKKIATLKQSAQSYLDKTAKSGNRYVYMIKSYDGSAFSWGNTLENIYLATPKLVSVKNEKDGVHISWNKVSGTQKYIVYRKTDKSGWTRLGTTVDSSFIDSTAKNGTMYYYTVKAQADYYDDAYNKISCYSSYNKTGLKIKYITAPVLTKISNEADGVRVYWNKVSEADGYYVYRRVTGTTTWTRIAIIKKGSTESYKDIKSAAGETYDYIIRAYSGNVSSAPAEKAIRIKRLTVPSLTSASNGNDGVTLKWKKVTGADSYIVYRKTYDAKTKKWSGWSRVEDGITTTSYIDKIVNSGTTYKYTVKACYGSYTSYYNTSGLEVIRLETPELSSATSTKAGVKLQWNKITGASGYKVYRKTGNDAWGEAIATVKGNSAITYVDKNAQKGVTYTYTVRAYNGNTKSGYIAEGKTVTDIY